MSGKPENSSNSIPGDIEKKNLEDDLFESCRTDSGFISSGNLIISEEIIDEPEKITSDNNFDEDFQEDKEIMLVDSGVCLSENFSNLSLKNSNLNNLSSKTHKPVECDRGKSPVTGVKQNIDNLWNIYYQQDDNGDTQLHLAILDGQLKLAYALIRKTPHPRLLDTPNDDALTPLHLAVTMQQSHIVRWLIIAGARPGPRNLAGDSPLHLAAKLGDVHCCKALMYPVQNQEREQLQLSYSVQPCPNFNIEQWNYDGQTCVHVAAQYGHIEILRHLLWYGANINAREGRAGNTALHYSVERNDENLLNFLLNECKKIDLNATNYGGNSALQLGYPIKENILQLLRQRGVASPYSSEYEYSSESEDEISFENFNTFIPNLVNASA